MIKYFCVKEISVLQSGNVIVHFSKDDEPVLLEILDASKFLTDLIRTSIKSESERPVLVK